MTRTLTGAAAVMILAFGAQGASAASICSGCEFIDGADGTYIGEYNPTTFDVGTFGHTDLVDDLGNDADFADSWVFDVNPGGTGTISANFTTFAGVENFRGALYDGTGTVCGAGILPTDCAPVLQVGMAIAQGTDNNWELTALGLAAGRYVLVVSGRTRVEGPSAYTGQLAFRPNQVPEPASLALLGLGLLGFGARARRAAS